MKPCYNITKKGCKFIAHKMTGTKGISFTARYINKFHDMEQAITQAQQPPQLPAKETYLLKSSKTWFQQNNWKMKMICDNLGWERKYLYHKLLRELSYFYNLDVIEDMYECHYGYRPRYKTDLIDFLPGIRRSAERYVDYLMLEIEED